MKADQDTDTSISRREFLGRKTLMGLAGVGALVASACTPSRNTARRTSRRVTRRTSRRINTLPRGYQTVTIGGESETAYGTACLQSDGSWAPAGHPTLLRECCERG